MVGAPHRVTHCACLTCRVSFCSSHIKFTPNSRFILASTQDSTIRLWNTQTSRCVKTYTGHANRTYCLFTDFAPGAKYIVSGSEDAKIYIWDLQTRTIAQVLEGHRGAHDYYHGTYYLHTTLLLSVDVVIAVAVRFQYVFFSSKLRNRLKSHPTKHMLASASMEKDMTIRLWIDANSAT